MQARAFYSFQLFKQGVHTEALSALLVAVLGGDEERVAALVREVACMPGARKKVEWVQAWIARCDFGLNKDPQGMCCQRIGLGSAFCCAPPRVLVSLPLPLLACSPEPYSPAPSTTRPPMRSCLRPGCSKDTFAEHLSASLHLLPCCQLLGAETTALPSAWWPLPPWRRCSSALPGAPSMPSSAEACCPRWVSSPICSQGTRASMWRRPPPCTRELNRPRWHSQAPCCCCYCHGCQTAPRRGCELVSVGVGPGTDTWTTNPRSFATLSGHGTAIDPRSCLPCPHRLLHHKVPQEHLEQIVREVVAIEHEASAELAVEAVGLSTENMHEVCAAASWQQGLLECSVRVSGPAGRCQGSIKPRAAHSQTVAQGCQLHQAYFAGPAACIHHLSRCLQYQEFVADRLLATFDHPALFGTPNPFEVGGFKDHMTTSLP